MKFLSKIWRHVKNLPAMFKKYRLMEERGFYRSMSGCWCESHGRPWLSGSDYSLLSYKELSNFLDKGLWPEELA